MVGIIKLKKKQKKNWMKTRKLSVTDSEEVRVHMWYVASACALLSLNNEDPNEHN